MYKRNNRDSNFKMYGMLSVFLLLVSFTWPPKEKIKIWLIGDSTMCPYPPERAPLQGWGMQFARFFDSTVEIKNKALGGRSTRTFIGENRWQPVADSLHEGDYVFMQFGHNDEAREPQYAARYTTPEDYKKNLTRFITETRKKKAFPVLVTPVTRMKFDSAGNAQPTHKEYSGLMYEVAKETNTPLIDLDANSLALLQRLGPVGAKLLFNQLEPGENPNYPMGIKDNTHFNELGARKMAELVLAGIRALHLPLTDRILSPGAKIVVASDGSGNYRSVQAALNAIAPDNRSKIQIYIRNGVYKEKMQLDSSKDYVTLIGEDKFKTILTYDDHTGKTDPRGNVINTRTSASFTVKGNDFHAENLTFRNDAGFTAGQAVGVEVQGDRACFKNCRIIGNQDILFTSNSSSRQYYKNCYIEGTTDFIFGAATVWFEQCQIHSKKNSHITAASTPQEHAVGYVFNECILTGDSALHNVSLGRPWRPYGSVTYIHCYIGQHIRPEGWSNWNTTDYYKTARYAEHENFGPGAEISGRVKWSKQLSAAEIKMLTARNVLGDWDPEQN